MIAGIHILQPGRQLAPDDRFCQNCIGLFPAVDDANICAIIPHGLNLPALLRFCVNEFSFCLALDKENTALANQDTVRDTAASQRLKFVLLITKACRFSDEIAFYIMFRTAHVSFDFSALAERIQ